MTILGVIAAVAIFLGAVNVATDKPTTDEQVQEQQ